MKCRICGAKLKKDGDICTNCYKEFQEEEDLKKDTNERLKIKRKYSINYELVKCTEIIILAILSLLLCISVGGVLESLGVVLIFAVIIGMILFIDKRLSMATKAVFYDKKTVYTFKFLFFDVTKVVKYSDIADVRYFQTRRQKKYGFGDLCVYAKGIIPGSGFLNGYQIKNIENVEEVLKQIGEIIGPIEE